MTFLATPNPGDPNWGPPLNASLNALQQRIDALSAKLPLATPGDAGKIISVSNTGAYQLATPSAASGAITTMVTPDTPTTFYNDFGSNPQDAITFQVKTAGYYFFLRASGLAGNQVQVSYTGVPVSGAYNDLGADEQFVTDHATHLDAGMSITWLNDAPMSAYAVIGPDVLVHVDDATTTPPVPNP